MRGRISWLAVLAGAALVAVGTSGCAATEETKTRQARPVATKKISSPHLGSSGQNSQARPKSVKPKPAEPSVTASQENALRAAEGYLSYTALSESGLEEQLKFEGYSAADSMYAAAHSGADWDEQAVKAATSYLGYQSFSESGLVEQLKFDGYTTAQAEYGVTKAYH